MNFADKYKGRDYHRAVLDLLGYSLSSYFIVWLAYVNKKASSDNVSFDYGGLIILFCIFVSTYALIFGTRGNIRWRGTYILLMTSLISSLFYVCLSAIWLLLTNIGDAASIPTFSQFITIGLLFVFLPSVSIVGILRIILYPLYLFSGGFGLSSEYRE